MKLHERLKAARTQNNYTQQEVADKLHVSRATISSWEVGRTLPSLDCMIDLSNLYHLSLDVLLKEDMIMVHQISKEIKRKKIYKGIVCGVGLLLFVFIMVNVVWVVGLKNSYSYLDEHWQSGKKYYSFQDGDIFLTASKRSLKDQFTFNYLKKNNLWVSAYKGSGDDSDYKPHVIYDGIDFTAQVPIEKRERALYYVAIDKDGVLDITKDNPYFINDPTFIEYREYAEKFLKEHNSEFKSLCAAADKQYKLVNKISN